MGTGQLRIDFMSIFKAVSQNYPKFCTKEIAVYILYNYILYIVISGRHKIQNIKCENHSKHLKFILKMKLIAT